MKNDFSLGDTWYVMNKNDVEKFLDFVDKFNNFHPIIVNCILEAIKETEGSNIQGNNNAMRELYLINDTASNFLLVLSNLIEDMREYVKEKDL